MTAPLTSPSAFDHPDPAAPDARAAASQLKEPSLPTEPVQHLNQAYLARRWDVSHRTLERWRWLKQGPAYVKVGGRVVYRLSAVEAYEAAQTRLGEG
jgi:hypothetical protein